MTVTLTLTAEPAKTRVRIAAHTNLPAASWFQVQRSTDQQAWTSVRGDGGIWHSIAGADRTTYDVECPFDTPLWYRGAEQAADGTVSSWGPTAGPVTLAGQSPMWLIEDYQQPSNGLWVCVQSHPADTYAGPRGIFHPIGRADPVVAVRDTPDRHGRLTVYAADAAERDRVLAALAPDGPLLVRADSVSGWGARYIAVGDLTATRRTRQRARPRRGLVSGPWTQIRPPAGVPDPHLRRRRVRRPDPFSAWNAIPTTFATWDALANWNGQ